MSNASTRESTIKRIQKLSEEVRERESSRPTYRSIGSSVGSFAKYLEDAKRSGLIMSPEEEAQEAAKKEATDMEEEEKFRCHNMPHDMIKATRNVAIDESIESMRVVRKFIGYSMDRDYKKKTLVLCGSVGVGKSFAAAMWCRDNTTTKFATWISASDYCNAIWDKNAALLRSAKVVSRLVIDELGAEYDDKHGRSAGSLCDLIRGRIADELYTVITTNLVASDLRGSYGDRLTSRLSEVGVVMHCHGDDLRQG